MKELYSQPAKEKCLREVSLSYQQFDVTTSCIRDKLDSLMSLELLLVVAIKQTLSNC